MPVQRYLWESGMVYTSMIMAFFNSVTSATGQFCLADFLQSPPPSSTHLLNEVHEEKYSKLQMEDPAWTMKIFKCIIPYVQWSCFANLRTSGPRQAMIMMGSGKNPPSPHGVQLEILAILSWELGNWHFLFFPMIFFFGIQLFHWQIYIIELTFLKCPPLPPTGQSI